MLCKKPAESRQLLLGEDKVLGFFWREECLSVFKENLHTRGNSRPVYAVSYDKCANESDLQWPQRIWKSLFK